MHELGVVFYVIRDVKKVAQDNNVCQINSVTLQIGEVSGIIHEQLIDCWNWARKKETETVNAQLIIQTVPAVTFCEDCENKYPTVQYGKICPACGSKRTYLLQGNEFSIKEIAVNDSSGT